MSLPVPPPPGLEVSCVQIRPEGDLLVARLVPGAGKPGPAVTLTTLDLDVAAVAPELFDAWKDFVIQAQETLVQSALAAAGVRAARGVTRETSVVDPESN